MLNFIVLNSPGWGQRILKEKGSENGQIGAISPRMLEAIAALREDQHQAEVRVAAEEKPAAEAGQIDV